MKFFALYSHRGNRAVTWLLWIIANSTLHLSIFVSHLLFFSLSADNPMSFFPLPFPAICQTALSIEQRETAFTPLSALALTWLVPTDCLLVKLRQCSGSDCVCVSTSVIQCLVDPNNTQDLRHAQWQERPSCPNTNKVENMLSGYMRSELSFWDWCASVFAANLYRGVYVNANLHRQCDQKTFDF